jgi:hypothetical protein
MQARAFLPSSALPLVYFAGAHGCLALAFGALAVEPGMAGAFYYAPKILALVHLVTLGWISGSILGALYIVMPLAFGVPMRATRLDVMACLAFWSGLAGMVGGFSAGRFDVVGGASLAVLAAVIAIGLPVVRGLRHARAPRGVSLHVGLAFGNLATAGIAGLLLALSHLWTRVVWSPLSLAAAHAHLAVLGWATMMIVGVSYRLIPMFLPAAMPEGSRLGASAVLLEIGALGVAGSLALESTPLPWLAFVVAALAVFLRSVRWVVQRRRPRPVELPRRDWSTWQTHVAILYLVVAVSIGLRLAIAGGDSTAVWIYGTTGLVGFVSQMVIGISGRLLPMLAWYRACEKGDGVLPARSVHALIVPRLALAVFVLWAVGVPGLLFGIALGRAALVAVSASLLVVGVTANAGHIAAMLRRAGSTPGSASGVTAAATRPDCDVRVTRRRVGAG